MDIWKELLAAAGVCMWLFMFASMFVSPLFFIPFAFCAAIVVYILMKR